MESLARFVLRHRLLVVLGWVVLMVAGGIAAGPVTDRLTFDFSLPGQPGYEAEQQLISTFGASTADTLVPVLTVPAGETVQFRATSVDVVHGFWIPAMKFQRELIPGQTATFDLTFPRPGFTTSGTCSFFCGLEHASMHFTVNVLSPADYDAWVRKSS